MKNVVARLFLTAVLVAGARAQTDASSTPSAEAGSTAHSGSKSQSFTISYVESDRRWRFGLRSEPYNKISRYFRDSLVDALERKGIRQIAKLDGATCCAVSLELLDVSIRPAMLKKPGMDVAATVTILDANQHPIYAKGFHGESKTLMNTYGHLIDHAIENMVESIVADQDILDALVDGTH